MAPAPASARTASCAVSAIPGSQSRHRNASPTPMRTPAKSRLPACAMKPAGYPGRIKRGKPEGYVGDAARQQPRRVKGEGQRYDTFGRPAPDRDLQADI